MNRSWWLAWVCVGVCNLARAQPVLDTEIKAGAPPRTRHLVLEPGPKPATWQLRIGDRRTSLPWEDVQQAEHSEIPLVGGAQLVRVQAVAGGAEYAALIGGRGGDRVLWHGRVDARGDPGERRRKVIEVTPAEDDGFAVAVGEHYEPLADCAGEPVLLERRHVDPGGARLTRGRPAPTPGEATEVSGTPLESLRPPSALTPLRALAATDLSGRKAALAAPRLDDGDATTALVAAPGADAVVWRANFSAAGFPITRLELEAPAAARLPGALWVRLGPDALLKVTAPGGARRMDVKLPTAVEASCLTLRFSGEAGRRVGVGELRAVTDLDTREPAVVLAEALVEEGAGASHAARLLARLGAEGARATLAVWPRLDTGGRRRALPVLRPWLGEPEVRQAMVEAARDPSLHEAAIAALASSQGAGREALSTLARKADATGEAAVRALAGIPASAPSLLGLLALPDGADRQGVREALGALTARSPEAFETAAQAWLDAEPSERALAAFALSVAGRHPRLSPLVQRACERAAWPPEAGFVERYRCAGALAELAAEPETDAWLASQARKAEEWMQRRAALDALATRGSPLLRETATGALDDPYPRVRAAAARMLGKGPLPAALPRLAQDDPWPLVRRAAVEAMAHVPEAGPLLRERVSDGARSVRAAAIDALAAQRNVEAWPAVQERLLDPREFPQVRTAGVRFASTLCLADATNALLGQLHRAMGPAATPEDVAVAIDALRALRRLGGPSRERAEAWLRDTQAPEGLSRAAGQPAACPTKPDPSG